MYLNKFSYNTKVQKASPRKRIFYIFIQIWLVVFFLAMIATVFVVGLFYNTWWYKFKQTSQLSEQSALELIKTGLKTPVKQTNGRKNILLLGTDVLSNRVGDPVLTDTIILFSLNLENGEFTAISLPRDLWSVEYKTKINSLYEYGKDRFPGEPQRFPKEVIENLTGVTVHNTIVLSLDQLKELIDDLGGVSVTVPEGFVDEAFPRTDVDIRTEHDPKKLYQRVEFTQGVETMNGERALQFVRSRHSTQQDQGTDNARSLRQQSVINAIIAKLRDRSTLQDPVILGKIFDWYYRNFQSELSVEELIQIGYLLQEQLTKISITPQTLSFELDGKTGVITHPAIGKYNQWVYEIKNDQEFKQEVKQKLKL